MLDVVDLETSYGSMVKNQKKSQFLIAKQAC